MRPVLGGHSRGGGEMRPMTGTSGILEHHLSDGGEMSKQKGFPSNAGNTEHLVLPVSHAALYIKFPSAFLR